MPITQLTFIRTTLSAILLGVASVLAIVSATLWFVAETRTNSEAVLQTGRQRVALLGLRDLLLNAETGQRGYLLSNERSYLVPYEYAIANIGVQIGLVRKLTPDPEQKPAIDRLDELLTNKMSELGQTVKLAENGQLNEALAVVKSNRGRDLMNESRKELGDLIASADQKIANNIAAQQSSIASLRFVTFAGAFVMLAVTVGAGIMALRYTKQLAQAQQDVQDLNAGLEERVRERTADLGRANDEIQRFAYIVTHDLRAPLVNIMGFTSELETSLQQVQTFVGQTSDTDDDIAVKEARTAALEDLPEAIGFIRSSTRKMDGLINAILKLSREGRRTLKPELIDLEALLHTVSGNIQHQLIDAEGTLAIEGRLPPILSDRMALDQIFGNLLDNAVKYRDKSRPLSIRIHVGNEKGRQVFITVEDNGRGIAPQDHERVFDLFRRSGAQDQPGEGIGLAHVRSMARNLGGDISITSDLGRGTTFKVILPKDIRRAAGVA